MTFRSFVRASVIALLIVAALAIVAARSVAGRSAGDPEGAAGEVLRVRLAAKLTESERRALGEAARAAGYAGLSFDDKGGPFDAELVSDDGVVLDLWALIAHPFSPVRDVGAAALPGLLLLPDPAWSSVGGPDEPVLRLGLPWLTPVGREATPEAYADLVRRVGTTPGSLAVVPAMAVSASVRTLTVDGVGPVDGPAASGRYPLKRSVRLRPLGSDAGRLAEIERGFAERAEVVLPAPIRLVALGSTIPARCAYARMRDLGDYRAAWRDTADMIRAADIAIVNVEAVPSDIAAPIGCEPTFSFIAPAATTDGFAFAGVDIVSLANNHSRDYGPAALLDGIDRLTAAGITVVGAGPDANAAGAPVFREIEGVRFAFLAFDDVAGAAYGATDTLAGTSPYDERRMAGAIAAARADSDVVIVMLQWGAEYALDADRRQRAIAAVALDAGAGYVYGDGPHVPQGLEFVCSASRHVRQPGLLR